MPAGQAGFFLEDKKCWKVDASRYNTQSVNKIRKS